MSKEKPLTHWLFSDLPPKKEVTPSEFRMEKYYIIHAPHLKPKEWVLQYQVRGSWDTVSFETFDDVATFMRQGQAELYVHATRGREKVFWASIEVPMYKLKMDTKWVEFDKIDWHLEQPIFSSEGLGHDVKPQWIWRIAGYDRERHEGIRYDAREEDLLKGHYGFPSEESSSPEEKPSSFANWVVVMQTKEAKKHFKSTGVGSEEEAKRVKQDWDLELLRTGKDRWREVVIRAPPSGVTITFGSLREGKTIPRLGGSYIEFPVIINGIPLSQSQMTVRHYTLGMLRAKDPEYYETHNVEWELSSFANYDTELNGLLKLNLTFEQWGNLGFFVGFRPAGMPLHMHHWRGFKGTKTEAFHHYRTQLTRIIAEAQALQSKTA